MAPSVFCMPSWKCSIYWKNWGIVAGGEAALPTEVKAVAALVDITKMVAIVFVFLGFAFLMDG